MSHFLKPFRLWGLTIVSPMIIGCSHKTATVPVQPQMMALALPVAGHCRSIDGVPDATCTPGAVRTTSVDSICHGGSTVQYRPSTSYTNALKKNGIVEYGYADSNMQSYEEDHLISLEIGGDGSSPQNLWPQPHGGKYNSYLKDQVENWLHKQVCSGAMTPQEAQQGIAKDWRQYIPYLVKTSHKDEVQ